jgi:hypothetical protein
LHSHGGIGCLLYAHKVAPPHLSKWINVIDWTVAHEAIQVQSTRFNPRVQALAIRLAQKGKSKMVIVGAAMRLLTHLIFGVLKHQTAFDPAYQNKTSPRAAASPQLAPGGG